MSGPDSPPRKRPCVLDVASDFGPDRRTLFTIGAASLALGLVAWAGYSGLERFVSGRLPPFSVVVALGLVGVLAVAVTLGRRWTRRRARSCLKSRQQYGLNSAINQAVVKAGWVDAGACVEEIMRALVYDRSFGTAIRLCRRDRCTPIEPLPVPFEPCPLLAGDRAFEDLAGVPPPGGPAVTPDSGPARPPPRRVYRPSSLRRLALTLPTLVGIAAYITARQAGVPVWYALPACAIGFGVAASGLWAILQKQSAQPEGKEWFLVPGGLAVRKTGLMRSDWQVLLFTRNDSVLCTHRREDPIWVLTARSDRERETAEVTQYEMEVALRAWLSPFEPPTAAQLVDLT